MISNDLRQLLIDTGYPPDILIIDFETYFNDKYSLKKISTSQYINSPEFEVLSVGLLWDYEYENQRFVDEEHVLGSRVADRLSCFGSLDQFTVIAHNAVFDLSILDWVYGIRPAYTIDLLGLCRHWETRVKNGIGDLVQRYNIGTKGDTNQFQNQTYRDRPNGKVVDEQSLEKYTLEDVRHEHELFKIMMPRLSNPTFELKLMRHTLNLFTQPEIVVDYKLAEDLKYNMNTDMNRACALANITPKVARSTKEFAELLETLLVKSGNDPNKYKKQGKKGPIFALAKDDEELKGLKQHSDSAIRNLIGARSACKSWPLHIKRINRIVDQANACGNKLPVPLKYHGAHTGRYSGGEKINLQNLGARGHELIVKIRELLKAPDGKTFVIVDSSQIEARVLAWWACENTLVTRFANGEDVYKSFAAESVLHKPIAEITKAERNGIGKVGVLACGYGMGWKKAQSYSTAYVEEPISDELAQVVVKSYREAYPRVVRSWYESESAFRNALRGFPPKTINKVTFKAGKQCDIIIKLPSGRELKYHEVRLKDQLNGYSPSLQVYNKLERTWTHIWGGHLVENIVQAIARDLLCYFILEIEEQTNCRVLLTVHDELIISCPTELALHVLSKSIKIMRTPPRWATGCPLDADGCISERYGGHN